MRQLIVDLKAEYADFTDGEIAAICAIQFSGRRPSRHTVKAVLADGPPPQRSTRQFPRYEEIGSPEERRHAVIRLHAQGWSVSTIARYLEVSRPTIYAILIRRLDRLGYAHFRRWKLYGEEALARHPTVIWLHGDALTVEYQETPLAQYTVRYQPDKKHFKAVPEARRFETPYRSLQGRLWELDETLWHLAKRLPDYTSRKKQQKKPMPLQLPLLEDPPVAQE